MKIIELLAPAKNVEIGKAAFDHGADAVYIGAPRFSARAAAGNEISEIKELAEYGHMFGAKTFVAFNTLVSDSELIEAEQMMWQLYEAGVDALIIQDLGLLKLNLPPIELHASTQADVRTVEKAKLLRRLGFKRLVLARELDIMQIREIHEKVPDVELECFVHGALCVSVSGQCYLSAALMGRSANRGVCAQPCRLPMDLINANGETLIRQKHLLCLKDMNRSQQLESLIEAGVTSLKIEGRLKDISYVKNITAHYRQEIEFLKQRHLKWFNASDGEYFFDFDPLPYKSFNRGFTSYLNDRQAYWNFDTPKSVGERIGHVIGVKSKYVRIVSSQKIENGDGLLVGNVGFRANFCYYHPDYTDVCPLDTSVLSEIKVKDVVYRNYDIAFERQLSRTSAVRRIPLDIHFGHDEHFATLAIFDGKNDVSVRRGPFEPAKNASSIIDLYKDCFCSLGNTIFYPHSYEYQPLMSGSVSIAPLFVPRGIMNEMRREAIAILMEKRAEAEAQRRCSFVAPNYSENAKELDARNIIHTDFRANAMNHLAKEILTEMKLEDVAEAFENKPDTSHPVMLTRHCLKFALGQCPLHFGKDDAQAKAVSSSAVPVDVKNKWIEPMSLKIGNKMVRIKFGCAHGCYSELYL